MGARDNEDNWRRSDKLPVINNLISTDSSQKIVAQESKDSLSYEKLLKIFL